MRFPRSTRKACVTLCLAVLFCGTVSAAEVRRWRLVSGDEFTAKVKHHPTKMYIVLDNGMISKKFSYNEFCSEDIVWLCKRYSHLSEPIKAVMAERIPKLVKDMQLEDVDKLGKGLPFIKDVIDSALLEHTKDRNYPEINQIAVNFPDIRPSILKVLAGRLANPTDEFLGIGKFSDFGNHNQYMEAKIAAYEEIASKYPEVRKNVANAIIVELKDTTKNRFWEDLLLLSRLLNSFPETGPAVKDVLLRSIRNPATLEKKQHVVYYDGFGVRFSRDEVTEYMGGWKTKRGHHPVTPREVLSIDVFDRGRMEAIKTQWPVMQPHLEAAIIQELRNTARRWSWDELRELVKSFPNIRGEAEAVVARDLDSPKSQFDGINWAEMLEAFPNLNDVIARRIERDLADPRKVFAPEALIELVQRYPDVQQAAEARLRAQMENPVFNRDFENLDRLDEIVQAFPNLKDCAGTVLARMINNPMHSGDGSDGGKPDLEQAKAIALRFPDMLDEVEAVFKESLRSTLVTWKHEERLELKTILPNLEPTLAENLARELNSGIKEYKIDELLLYAKQFPSIKDHCADLVLEHVKDPKNRVDLKKLMEVVWRFPSLAQELEKDIRNAVNQIIDNRYYYNYHDYHWGRLIEFLCSLMREYPDQEELIRGVIYERIERVVQHSDETSLKEWVENFDLPYDERVAKALAAKKVIMEKPDSSDPGTATGEGSGTGGGTGKGHSESTDETGAEDPEAETGTESEVVDPGAESPSVGSGTGDAGAKVPGTAAGTPDPGKEAPGTRSGTEGSTEGGGGDGEDALPSPPIPETWGEVTLRIVKTHWIEISVGVLGLGLFIYLLLLYRRFKRWRKRVWDERHARFASGDSTRWDNVMYRVWRNRPATGASSSTEGETDASADAQQASTDVTGESRESEVITPVMDN